MGQGDLYIVVLGMGVLMYKRLVDYVNMVVRTRGVYDNGQKEKQNTEFIQSVANEIHPSIQVNIDYPRGRNSRGRTPILDLCVTRVDVYCVTRLPMR